METVILALSAILFLGLVIYVLVTEFGLFKEPAVIYEPKIKEIVLQVQKKYYAPSQSTEPHVYPGSGAARGVVFNVPILIPEQYEVILSSVEHNFHIVIPGERLYNRIPDPTVKVGYVVGVENKKKYKTIYIDYGKGKEILEING